MAAAAFLTSAAAQNFVYLNQFATLAEDIQADVTGTYMTVDSTRQVFPTASQFGKVISLRKFNNQTGAEEWSRELVRNENVIFSLNPKVALDFSGVYVSYSEPSVSSALQTRVVVQKYHRDGTLLWRRELATVNNEAAGAVAAANGFVYVATLLQSGSGNQLYRLDPATGAVVGSTPAGPKTLVNGLGADSSGIYLLAGFSPLTVRKFDLNGLPVWVREVGAGSVSGRDLLVHPSGIWAHAYQFSDQKAIVVRFDANGNTLLTDSFQSSSSAGAISPSSLVAVADGVIAAGAVSGGLAGVAGIGLADVYVRKYGFDGAVQSNLVAGQAGFEFFQPQFVFADGALQIGGRSNGTWAGNPPDNGTRALLGRLTLPVPPPQSLTSILDTIPGSSANPLRNRVGAVCNQLDSLLRDLQSQRGKQLPPVPADLAATKVGEAQTLLGCKP
jgi:outer membrane protein assembly factor BamB